MSVLNTYHANATGHPTNVESGAVHSGQLRAKIILIAASASSRIEIYDGISDAGQLKMVSEHFGRNTDMRPEVNPDQLIFRTAAYIKIVSGACDVFLYG